MKHDAQLVSQPVRDATGMRRHQTAWLRSDTCVPSASRRLLPIALQCGTTTRFLASNRRAVQRPPCQRHDRGNGELWHAQLTQAGTRLAARRHDNDTFWSSAMISTGSSGSCSAGSDCRMAHCGWMPPRE